MLKLHTGIPSSLGNADPRSLESASRLHHYCPELDDPKLSYALDDASGASLDLDQVFAQIDCSLFFGGSQYLYARMRRPWVDGQKISKIQEGLERLSSNHRLREGMEREFRRLSALPGKQVAALLWGEARPSPLPRWVLIALPLALLASMVLALVVQAKFWLLAMPLFALLCYVHHYLQLRTSAHTDALLSLRRMTRARQRMRKLEGLEALSDLAGCDRALAKLRAFRKGGLLSELPDPTGLMAYFNIAMLYEARFYSAQFRSLHEHKEELRKIFLDLAFLDYSLGLLTLRERWAGTSSLPHFEAGAMRLENCAHPLVSEPVPNSIELDKQSLILTGMNMAGKSTFLRSVGVNVVLAQSALTVLCTSYHAPLLRLRACMGNQDKLSEGVSFYLSELKSLENFVRAANSDEAWIFILDEIFRGTNGDERIAASVAVLEHLGRRHRVLAATHDQAMLDHLGPHFLRKSFSGQPCDEKGLRFDFRLREGPCFDRNALRLMRHLEFPKTLVERAEALVCPATRPLSSTQIENRK